MENEKTIAAISTPPGRGGIGIIRISGPKSLAIGKRLIDPENPHGVLLKDRYLKYAKIRDLEGDLLDEALMVYMKGPKSYTGEDVVEIQAHGSYISMERILKEILKNGAFLAEPGEFTKRAFLNGRMDLSQAEAVMDLINAKTKASHNLSLRQMEGKLSRKINDLKERLLSLLAHIEVTIDYPEEDIDEIDRGFLKDTLISVRDDIDGLLEGADEGLILREGIKLVIAGKTNVGKSSLLNALAREDRAIVTDIPGTTRDIIEEDINLKGIMLKIIDTAGIRETEDEIEKLGIERTRKNIEDSDLVILVVDASAELDQRDMGIFDIIKDKRLLVILNKIDREILVDIDSLKSHFGEKFDYVETSMTGGIGLDSLEDKIVSMFLRGDFEDSESILIDNLRQKEALESARLSILDAIASFEEILPVDMISFDIFEALNSLARITGESMEEDLIHKIFSEFCLGK